MSTHQTLKYHSSSVYFCIPTKQKYFIRNTGTGSDGRSCHLSHCPTSSWKTTKYKWNIIAKNNKKTKQMQIPIETLHKLTTPNAEQLKKSHIEFNHTKSSLHCSNPRPSAYESAIAMQDHRLKIRGTSQKNKCRDPRPSRKNDNSSSQPTSLPHNKCLT